MSEDEFTKRIQELTRPSSDDPEYELHMDQSGRLVEQLVWDASQKSMRQTGKMWDEAIALECFTQFEWLHKQP